MVCHALSRVEVWVQTGGRNQGTWALVRELGRENPLCFAAATGYLYTHSTGKWVTPVWLRQGSSAPVAQ